MKKDIDFVIYKVIKSRVASKYTAQQTKVRAMTSVIIYICIYIFFFFKFGKKNWHEMH